MKNITVIGSGTMGNGIAHTLAQHNYNVVLVDINQNALTNAIQTISKNLDRLIDKQKILNQDKLTTLSNITTNTNINNSQTANADLVIEAATEQTDVKLKIFKQLNEICQPNTILASNTSSISITKIAAATNRPDKVIGMHFMNPVPIMKLVEIIAGYATSNQTTQTIVELTNKINKVPVVVNDYPGFIANRILLPMINEAIYALHEGVAGVTEIDTIMKLGMAHPMGPLQLADFIGLDVCLSILNVLFDGFGNQKYAPCPLLTNMVNAGKLGIKSGEGFYIYNPNSKDLTPANFKKINH